MVRPRGWHLLTDGLDAGPGFLVKVKVKQVVEVLASLALVATKEVETIHEGDASSARSLLGLISDWVYLRPTILTDAILIQIVQSFVIVCPRKEVDVSIGKDALVTCSRSKNLPL